MRQPRAATPFRTEIRPGRPTVPKTRAYVMAGAIRCGVSGCMTQLGALEDVELFGVSHRHARLLATARRVAYAERTWVSPERPHTASPTHRGRSDILLDEYELTSRGAQTARSSPGGTGARPRRPLPPPEQQQRAGYVPGLLVPPPFVVCCHRCGHRNLVEALV